MPETNANESDNSARKLGKVIIVFAVVILGLLILLEMTRPEYFSRIEYLQYTISYIMACVYEIMHHSEWNP